MATLHELVEAGTLRRVKVRLGRNQYDDRNFYAYPDFHDWLFNDVKAAQSFYAESIRPSGQALDILKTYITGKTVTGTRMFTRMRPITDDVWEMRTDDLRFFGWVPEPNSYIAVVGDFFEHLKADPSLYELYRIKTLTERAQLNLDDPKYIAGAQERDIVTE